MNKTKSLLSIIFIAIISAVVMSCGDDGPEKISGVTLAGEWVTTPENGLSDVHEFDYEGVKIQRQYDMKYIKFTPKTKFSTSGTGTIVTHFPQGDLEYTYRTFTWTLDKENPDDIVTNIVFDDNKKPHELILYRTHISETQFSFAINDEQHDITAPIAFSRLTTSFNWDAFKGSGEIKRENWEELYRQELEEEAKKAKEEAEKAKSEDDDDSTEGGEE